jgi:hypothetical protein
MVSVKRGGAKVNAAAIGLHQVMPINKPRVDFRLQHELLDLNTLRPGDTRSLAILFLRGGEDIFLHSVCLCNFRVSHILAESGLCRKRLA